MVEHKDMWRAIVGTVIAIGLVPMAKGSSLVATPIGSTNVAVPEGKGGSLSWKVSNTDPTLNITLNNDVALEVPGFNATGPDFDDVPALLNFSGCVVGVVLVASTGSCVITFSFTTPAVPDANPSTDENSDRGFANLVRTKNSLGTLTVDGCTDGTTTCAPGTSAAFVQSNGLAALVEVDDPGVPQIIPESSTISLMSLGLAGLFTYGYYRRGRSSKRTDC